MRTRDYGLSIKHGLGIKRADYGLRETDSGLAVVHIYTGVSHVIIA